VLMKHTYRCLYIISLHGECCLASDAATAAAAATAAERGLYHSLQHILGDHLSRSIVCET